MLNSQSSSPANTSSNVPKGPDPKNQNLFELLEQWPPPLPRPEEQARLQPQAGGKVPGFFTKINRMRDRELVDC